MEMMIATVILLVALVAVAQLVPASVLLNQSNRMDSSALVFAQRELDQMLDQPLISTVFIDSLGNICQLGSPPPPNTVNVLGNNVVTIGNQTHIDFSPTATPVPGYSFIYTDFKDPSGAGPKGITYDVRWAVVVIGNGGGATSKRFILGVRQLGGESFVPPVTLDTMVTR